MSGIRCCDFLFCFPNYDGYFPNGGKYLSILHVFLNIFLYSKDVFYFCCVGLCVHILVYAHLSASALLVLKVVLDLGSEVTGDCKPPNVAAGN